MRVYVLTPSFPPGRGGQELQLQELAEQLIVAGMPTRVIAAAQVLPPPAYVDTVPVTRVKTFGQTQGTGWRAVPLIALLLWRVAWRLWRDRAKYDVILVSGFNVMPLAAVLSKALTGKCCVVRPESPSELHQAVGAANREKMGGSAFSFVTGLAERLRRAAARRVDLFVAISSEIRAGLISMGVDASRIVDIPNGINSSVFRPVSAMRRAQLRAALGLPGEALLVVYTGRLALSKGVMMLMEAWAHLAKLYPCAHLVLVGTGAGSSDDCEAAAREFTECHGLQGRVTFTGSVENVQEYLQCADIFAFPSDYEGFGLSILEAMAVALPMVCTEVGVAADLGRDAEIALLVPPKEPPAFVRALSRLLAEPALRHSLGMRAGERVQRGYSMEAVAERYARVFARLMERKV